MTLVLREHDSDTQVVVLTLNRPEARNALNDDLIAALLESVQQAAVDDAVRGIVLTGAGNRAFAAGADLDGLLRRDHLTETGPVSARRRELTRLLETVPKPTIAAMNGHALGGGLEIALGCDLRIIVPEAKVGFPEINLGIIPGNGGTQRAVRAVGEARALELILTGTPIDAARALEIGLVHRVVAAENLMTEAVELAGRLGRHSSRAFAAAKESTRRALDMPLDAGLSFENKWFAVLCATEEKTEAVTRIRESL